MKLWIFLAIAILLILWGSREGFDTPAPSCPAGLTRDMVLGEGTPNERIRCAKEMGEPTCPAGHTKTPRVKQGDAFVGGDCEKDGVLSDVRPTCPADSNENMDPQGKLVCMKYEFIPNPQPQQARGTSAGGTTGGSSTSSAGPNSGGASNRSKQVFGPTFTGRGEGDGVVPSDSSKTNQYPELIGGGNARPSTRIAGGDITTPSRSWQLSMNGSLPTTAGLGADENSRFLPFSRQPGDMETIPDPFRVSQQFSSASYSFKTDPVPFLTDFSAFQR